MRVHPIFRPTFLAVPLVLAGCAELPSALPEVLRYRCEDARSFTLTIAASRQSAEVEFDGMRFALRAAPAAGVPGEHFACDVMTVWREGDRGRIDMDGDTPFRNCSREP
jgi:hypothetical protein